MFEAEFAVVGDFGDLVVFARIGGFAGVAAHADGDIATSVEGVQAIDKRCGQFVVFGDGHGQQFAFFAGLQRVDHGQSQSIIAVVSHIGIEDQRHWSFLGSCGMEQGAGQDLHGKNRGKNRG